MKDMLDREINPGNRIAYPVRRGSEIHLELGQVEAIGHNALGDKVIFAYNSKGRKVSIRRIDNVLVYADL